MTIRLDRPSKIAIGRNVCGDQDPWHIARPLNAFDCHLTPSAPHSVVSAVPPIRHAQPARVPMSDRGPHRRRALDPDDVLIGSRRPKASLRQSIRSKRGGSDLRSFTSRRSGTGQTIRCIAPLSGDPAVGQPRAVAISSERPGIDAPYLVG